MIVRPTGVVLKMNTRTRRRLLTGLLTSLALTAGLPSVASAMPPDDTIARFDLDRAHDGLTYAGTAAPSWTRGQVNDAFRAFRTDSDHLVAPGPSCG